MTEPKNAAPDMQDELLHSITDKYETNLTFESCLNAHGMYETMRFVLRLSPRNHELMETIEKSDFSPKSISPELIRAYSTYIHETVHWWQHVGSTSGLLFSLSYLSQVHANMDVLRDVISTFGAKKPLKGWTDQVLLREGHEAQEKLASANIAVNNALDVEFYKFYAYDPRAHIQWMVDDQHFECVGHGYLIVYGQLMGMIASVIDPDFETLPQMQNWDVEAQRLSAEKCEGFYHGSPVRLPAVGLRAIYEGQARFIQLQFLDGTQQNSLSCQEWRDMGFLSGIYVEAFEAFLKNSETEWPKRITDPIVGLFLLVCDVAINPTRGLPFKIESFEDFILDVDVGVRFTRLCLAVKELPHLKQAIRDHSRDEYIAVSGELCDFVGYDHPIEALQEILSWKENATSLAPLMEEYRTFKFHEANLPLRVFVSHFVAFCEDKYKNPEFFCWPGRYMSGMSNNETTKKIWLRHLSLFSDRGDKPGVYPRKWPNRDDAAVKKTFKSFYGNMALYDLTRQWVLKDGPFVCDFRWLAENYNQEDADAWGNETFMQVYGVTLDQFEIVR